MKGRNRDKRQNFQQKYATTMITILTSLEQPREQSPQPSLLFERDSANVGFWSLMRRLYMHATSQTTKRKDSQIGAGRYNFEALKEFVFIVG